MNILFLTLLDFSSIKERSIYTDLLREFSKSGHTIFAISPVERRKRQKTYLIQEDDSIILKLRIGNIQKTNIVEKGISTLMIEPQFIAGIKKYFSDVKFDLVLYSTPPITFYKAIEYVKNRDAAKSYLMLKDIFPQNAVDLGMLSIHGVKSILYWYFRMKEKKLYSISDYIGCMSQANVDYVIKHNPEIDPKIVEVCPNSVEPIDMSVDQETRIAIRKKYSIPLDKKVFVYGGNLGKPQGIDFVIECLRSQKNNNKAFFLIIGDGTEFCKLEAYVNCSNQKNLKLMKRLPKEDYDTLVGACDVGMLFLNRAFTIPNFPSRILSYMQAKIPVLAVTDSNTDIGRIITDEGFGGWCLSGDIGMFAENIEKALSFSSEMGSYGFSLLLKSYSAKKTFQIISNSISHDCHMSKI